MKANKFFVRGFQKSGTNWVKNLLNLHPKILCRGEYSFFILINNIQTYILTNSLTKELDLMLKKHIENFIEEAVINGKGLTIREKRKIEQNKMEILWWGECTPSGIDSFITNDPIFLIIRDGRDIVISRIYHLLRHISDGNITHEMNVRMEKSPSLREKAQYFKKDPRYFIKNPQYLLTDEQYIKDTAKEWNNYMNAIFEKIKNHNVHIIKYEKLHTDFDNEKNKIYKFLGVDPMEVKAIPELCQPGFKEENPNSHFRKGVVGDWKNYFTSSDCKYFKEEAGKALVKLEYEKDLSWDNSIEILT